MWNFTNSVSAAFPGLTWIKNRNTSPEPHYPSWRGFKNIPRKREWQFWIIVWVHWERSAKVVMLWPAHCTFKCPVKFPLHRRLSLGRIVLHTVEVRSWREVDAVFQVFECDDFLLRTVNLCCAASRTLMLCVDMVCVRKQQVWQTPHSWKPIRMEGSKDWNTLGNNTDQ